ncbi:MAG: cupin domain-containing protein [Gammaproteobacteria bacterium]|nr:cupin domain-containing protein [Gammaproteobacteria bacterium]
MSTDAMSQLGYTRMYTDADGVSHFDEGELALSLENYAPPASPIAIHRMAEADGATLVFMPAGSFEDWHPAPRRQFAFLLSGTVEVTVSDGETRRFEPGSIVLLEDTTGKGHQTRIVGDEDHLSVMVPVPLD